MQNYNRVGNDVCNYRSNINNGAMRYTYQNGYEFPSNNSGYQSPCGSSTSSKTRRRQKRKYYESDDDNSDVEIRKKPRNVILSESLKAECTEEVDTIEDVLDTRLGREGYTGDETTIYNSIHDANPVKTGSERQYLIKWRNWSHIHATWESEESLKVRGKVEGRKKLENFIVKLREMERYKNSCSRDELERIMFTEEKTRESNYKKMQVERIVHHQYDNYGNLEYFIKWQDLDYKYVTAESSETVVEPLFSRAIYDYKICLRSPTVPDNGNIYLRRRPIFKPLPINLSFGTETSVLYLRDYQEVGVNWLLKVWTMGRNAILADEMGLGKTIQTVAFISILFRRYKIYGPFIIIVPLSTINNWKKEFELWAPEAYTVVYTGDISSRETIQKYELFIPNTKQYKFNVMLTTYEIAMNDKGVLSSIYWVLLAVDEAHRLKSNESKLYKTIYPFRTNCRLLITGTPLQNNIKELWALLHFIMPNDFEDHVEFENKFGTAENEQLCNEKLASLRETIEPFILRREKKDVEKSLPAKSEQILRINMSQKQKELYRLILAKNFESLLAQTNKRMVFKNVIVELKKCCNHVELISDRLATIPNIADREEYLIKSSGKMIVLDKLLSHLKAEGHRVLIFSQMVRMLDILDEYLRIKGWGFQRLDGSIVSNLRNEAINNFNAVGSTDFCFLLSTRAGGLGINLTSADTVIIFDSDWNPHADMQAMARAHRIGQTKQVSIYRFVIKSSVEEKIIERAKQKMVLDHLVIQRMESDKVNGSRNKSRLEAEDFDAILKFSAQEIFRDTNEETDFNLQTILKQAEIQNNENVNATSAFLSSFKVISLDTDSLENGVEIASESEAKSWNELIPKKYIDTASKSQGNICDALDLVRNKKEPVNNSTHHHATAPINRSIPVSNGSISSCTGKLNRIETRKLVTAMQKFGCPQQRAGKIITETLLNNKLTEDQAVQLIVDIVSKCKKCVGDSKETDDECVVEYNSYHILARPLLSKLELLEELHAVMNVYSTKERVHHQFLTETKPTAWGCPWDVRDDNHLLVGVYEYGMSAWRDIKTDKRLQLGDKILPTNTKMLPQVKHLNTRLHYLLDCLKRSCKEPLKLKIKLSSNTGNQSRSSTVNNTPEVTHVSNNQIDYSGSRGENLKDISKNENRSPQNSPSLSDDEESDISEESMSSMSDEEQASVNNQNEENSLLNDLSDDDFFNFKGDLFKQCKTYMKKCKEELAVVQKILTRNQRKLEEKCLYNNIGIVGNQIKLVVESLQSNQRTLYFRYLWNFVRIFCPDYSALELFQLYQKAVSKSKK